MFKKAFWVPYEDSANYPTLAKTMEAISKYCEENGESYTFINDDEVEINGKRLHYNFQFDALPLHRDNLSRTFTTKYPPPTQRHIKQEI